LEKWQERAQNNLRAGICTLGCKVNQYESEAIAEELERYGVGIGGFDGICDIYIINTCTVTGESDRKAGQMIRRAIRRNPDALVIVTGCFAQAFPDKAAAIKGVDIVCGNKKKLDAIALASDFIAGGRKPSQPIVLCQGLEGAEFEPMTIHNSERTRAYIKIEDGCECKCAYCIIPSVRGPIRSKPVEDVVAEAAGLVAVGYREIVLTGIETSAYSYGLPALMKALSALEGLERVRFGSLDPASMRRAFADAAVCAGNVMPSFHVSLQSGCDRTLHRMRRRYNVAQVRENLAYIRSVMPDVTFTADVICGFPGESDEDFDETCRFVSEMELLHTHVFTYSRRPGTEADAMPEQIPEHIKSARAAKLIALAEQQKQAIYRRYAQQNAVMTVLVEGWEEDSGLSWGHTPNFMPVYFISKEDLRGGNAKVKLTEVKEEKLYGVKI